MQNHDPDAGETESSGPEIQCDMSSEPVKSQWASEEQVGQWIDFAKIEETFSELQGYVQ